MKVSGFQETSTAIQNPFTFYYVQNNDWSSSHSYQFWNKNFTGAVGMNNDETLKTIYSPSPSGFVEPKTAAFTGFTSTGGNTNNVSQFNVSGSFNKGWNLYTNGWKTGDIIFINALLGYRDCYKDNSIPEGNIYKANTQNENYYWTVGSSKTTLGYSLAILHKLIFPQNDDYKSYGFNVLSVVE